jgi:hypothetical protein
MVMKESLQMKKAINRLPAIMAGYLVFNSFFSPLAQADASKIAITSRLSFLERDIQSMLDGAQQPTREQVMSLQGSVHGTINGKMVEHSPLSMAVLGLAGGALLGSGAGFAIAAPFVAAGAASGLGAAGLGAFLGGAAGAVGAPFIATGKGSISGSADGNINGSADEIYKMATHYGFLVLDPALLQGIKDIISANPDISPDSCTLGAVSALEKLQKQKSTLTTAQAFRLIADINEMKQKLQELLQYKDGHNLSPESILALGEQYDHYNDFVTKNKTLTIVEMGYFRPFIDVNRKLVVKEETTGFRKDSNDNIVDECGNQDCMQTQKDIPHGSDYPGHLISRYWPKDPRYTHDDFVRDFGPNPGRYLNDKGKIANPDVEVNFSFSQFKRERLIIPSLDSSGEATRLGRESNVIDSNQEYVPNEGQIQAQYICAGSGVQEAFKFLAYSTSSSKDTFLSDTESLQDTLSNYAVVYGIAQNEHGKNRMPAQKKGASSPSQTK